MLLTKDIEPTVNVEDDPALGEFTFMDNLGGGLATGTGQSLAAGQFKWRDHNVTRWIKQ